MYVNCQHQPAVNPMPVFVMPLIEGPTHKYVCCIYQTQSGTIRATKCMTYIDKRTRSRPELRRNGRKWPFLRFAEKRKTGRKSVFFQNNTRNRPKTDIYLGNCTFSFAQLCPVMARTWLGSRSGCFFLAGARFWPENLHFFTLRLYNPHFFGSAGPDSMGS